MPTPTFRPTLTGLRRGLVALSAVAAGAVAAAALSLPTAHAAPADHLRNARDPAASTVATARVLAPQLAVGDLVFIRVNVKPFLEVAAATGSWTNHVGIVISTAGAEPLIGESTVPWSGATTLTRFVARSENGRVAVSRLATPLSAEQATRVAEAARRRFGVLYDTGFDLHSRRQFCSRFVREVLAEATGVAVGDVQTFGSLLEQHPQANVAFWKLWYLGRIPWQRETVTPASVLQSRELTAVFDGVALTAAAQ